MHSSKINDLTGAPKGIRTRWVHVSIPHGRSGRASDRTATIEVVAGRACRRSCCTAASADERFGRGPPDRRRRTEHPAGPAGEQLPHHEAERAGLARQHAAAAVRPDGAVLRLRRDLSAVCRAVPNPTGPAVQARWPTSTGAIRR